MVLKSSSVVLKCYSLSISGRKKNAPLSAECIHVYTHSNKCTSAVSLATMTLYGTNAVKASLSKLSGKWTLCDCVNPAGIFSCGQRVRTPPERLRWRAFTHFKEPWTWQRSTVMESKWQLRSGKNPILAVKRKRLVKRTARENPTEVFSYYLVSFLHLRHKLPSQRGTLQNLYIYIYI